MITDRETAVLQAGEKLVAEAENTHADFSYGEPKNGLIRFESSAENTTHSVTIYFYQDADDVNAADDLADLNWIPSGYKVEES